MPSPNRLKDYVPDAFYHIYNRGVGKMNIFRAEEDYIVFLHYLRLIFSPVEILERELSSLGNEESSQESPQLPKVMRLRRAIDQSYCLELYKHVELLSFGLMPNHLHLLVYQKIKRGIEFLMRRLGTGYSGFFTKKYEHVGTTFQGAYKASHLYYETELQALVTARYIERNPLEYKKIEDSPRFYTVVSRN